MRKVLPLVALLVIAAYSFVYADSLHGTIPDANGVYLPFISNFIPSATPTPTTTPTPTEIPTFTPTATPTRDPKLPYPYDNDPKQVALHRDDVPLGWIVIQDDYEQPTSDWKAKRVVSIWYSSFYRSGYVEPAEIASTVFKYQTAEDAAAGFDRGIAYYKSNGYHEVNWPAVPNSDQSILLYGGTSNFFSWSELIVRKGNMRIDTEIAWINHPQFKLTDTCARTTLGRLIGSDAVVCNIGDYAVESSSAMQVDRLDHEPGRREIVP